MNRNLPPLRCFHAVSGLRPAVLAVKSRLPVSFVVTLEAAAIVVFGLHIMHRVADLWVQCLLLVVLSSVAYIMHYQ
jgi:hypothetical protein